MKKTILFCVIALTSPAVFANNVATETPAFSQISVQAIVKENNLKLRANKGDVTKFYADYALANPSAEQIWLVKDKLSKQGQKALALLEKSDQKGLFSNNYHIAEMKALLQGDMSNVDNQKLLDLLMTDAMLSYLRDVSVGQPELIVVEKKNWLLPRDSFDSAAELLNIIAAEDLEQQAALVEPKHHQYQALVKKLQTLLSQTDFSAPETQVKVGGKLSLNDQGTNVVLLNNRLIELGYLATDHQDQQKFDAMTKEAVQKFQRTHLLEPDGVVGRRTQQELNKTQKDRATQLIANIERWRWMPKDLGQHYLMVDIPSFEYYVVKDGKETVRAKTIVGKSQRSTPVFMAPMNHIVFAPYWHVPRSMAVKDQLPKLKRDPERLARSNIRIYDKDGNEIDPVMVDWSQYNNNNFPYRLRQDPGTYNALGKVKFMFPNKHAIYLHDTPQKSLFGKTERTFSSGCIRIENPIELAEYFLKDQDWKLDKIKKAYDGSSERTIRLKEDMRFPVYTIYMTAAVNGDDELVYRSDIYDRDGALQQKIAKLSDNL